MCVLSHQLLDYWNNLPKRIIISLRITCWNKGKTKFLVSSRAITFLPGKAVYSSNNLLKAFAGQLTQSRQWWVGSQLNQPTLNCFLASVLTGVLYLKSKYGLESHWTHLFIPLANVAIVDESLFVFHYCLL